MELTQYLDRSYTAYHAVANAAAYLAERGFVLLNETEPYRIEAGKRYFIVRDGSALIALSVGNRKTFRFAASHTDSPAFKVKGDAVATVEAYCKLNVEKYGGGLFYSWLDRPLALAGRAVVKREGKILSVPVASEETFVIPSVAIHFNRSANDGIKLNPQTDMMPLIGLDHAIRSVKELFAQRTEGEIVDWDLFVVCREKPFVNGLDGAFLSAPRIDNLTSAFASLEAVADCAPDGIAVAFLADNEEVGSATKQGAGSTFLRETAERVYRAIGGDNFDGALAESLFLSVDNAHALHPNHPELSDPTNRTMPGKGVVIKRHANQNYTTDALSAAIVKEIFDRAGVKHQDFYMRSDLPCGGTLGAISSSQLSVRSCDVGLAQLAMHSAVETFCLKDYEEMKRGIKAFFESRFAVHGYGEYSLS